MEQPPVQSAAITYSDAITAAELVAIAVGINKRATENNAPNPNPSKEAYQNICDDDDYALLVDRGFLSKFKILYNIQVKEMDNLTPIFSYFGFIAQHKMSKYVVIAIRGTQDKFETHKDEESAPVTFKEYTNITARVPKGFYKIFENARVITLPDGTNNEIHIPLSEFAANIDKHINVSTAQITVMGHSLGAAVATYFAATATANRTLANKLSLYLCTLASPMPGDANFVSTFNKNITGSARIFNVEDDVPNYPVHKENGENIYQHVAGGMAIDSTNDEHVNHNPKTGFACAHQLPVYKYLLEKIEGNEDANIISAGDDARCRVMPK
ncbi:lipase (class 3) [Chitinophaga skermanii]|uniref:Lipase (Class 3) n=1 Tax=Chitinophaga skermanii TaxID=331697 RepID=A0A327QPE5_9BACT|nr:hypothetical protein [Chitinophaga skermanii]RAJ05522.1 lipase (class 3) [Chitinophaga skermanii]